MIKGIIGAVIACVVTAGLGYGAANPPIDQSNIQSQVRKQLANLSRYTVFDNIAYRVDGTQVTLMGQVVLPVLKDDAGSAVKEIPGVTAVTNEIEVLPLSPMDYGIRRAEFRAIYNDPGLSRYAEGVLPAIHIIVKNGTVTLEGVVASQSDRDEAYIRANSVPGTFGVNNDLRVNPGL